MPSQTTEKAFEDEFDTYLKKPGYDDIKALVVFTAFTDRKNEFHQP